MKNHKLNAYDIIGDIHGCAAELEALLKDMGYREIGSSFRHPEGRRAIFVGDYLDRGPEIRRVLQIVRGMIDNGHALGILGNHEINALRYHQRGPDGKWLRDHDGNKQKQHNQSLEQIANPHPGEWCEWLHWLSHLPIWLDLRGLRIIHAAWSESHIGLLAGHGPLHGGELIRLSDKESKEGKAISVLINGVELKLPEGESFETPDGRKRYEIRSAWWRDLRGKSNREAVFPDDYQIKHSPALIPDSHKAYDLSAPPVFFGHYAVMNGRPEPLADNVACLDYGAAKGGRIGAYRWEGERILSSDKFFLSPKSKAYYG